MGLIRNPLTIIISESGGGLTPEQLQLLDNENKTYARLLNENQEQGESLVLKVTADKIIDEDAILKITKADLEYNSLVQTYGNLNSITETTNIKLEQLNNRLSVAVGSYGHL